MEERRLITGKKPQVHWVKAWGDNEENCREKNQEKGSFEIVKWKINAEKQTHPKCRKIYASDYAHEEKGVKG